MLPRVHRPTRKEIRRLFQRDVCNFSTRYLRVKVLQSEDASVFKCALIVGTIVSKRAVVRNRIKRMLGEAVREKIREFPSGVNCAISVKKDGGILISKKAADSEIQQLFSQLQSLCLKKQSL